MRGPPWRTLSKRKNTKGPPGSQHCCRCEVHLALTFDGKDDKQVDISQDITVSTSEKVQRR